MIYVRPLTPAEVDDLHDLRRHAIGRVSQRTHLILLSAQHVAVPNLAEVLACSCATVRFWIRRFDTARPDGLRDMPRSDRPRKVTPVVEATLSAVLHQDPRRTDYHLAGDLLDHRNARVVVCDSAAHHGLPHHRAQRPAALGFALAPPAPRHAPHTRSPQSRQTMADCCRRHWHSAQHCWRVCRRVEHPNAAAGAGDVATARLAGPRAHARNQSLSGPV